MRLGWSVTIISFLQVGIAASANAGIIVDIQDMPNPYAAVRPPTAEIDSTAPGDDDNTDFFPTNFVGHYLDSLSYDDVGPVDTVFFVDDSDNGDTTEYLIDQFIHNATGHSWIGFRLQLGFGTGDSFVPSTPNDGLDFDFPDVNSIFDLLPFSQLVHLEDELIWSNGVWSSGAPNLMSITVDVPHLPQGSFTLRQTPLLSLDLEPPVIPEPTAGMALGATAAIMLASRQRNWRKRR